jgi:polyisoprenoid-binding protein YceI
MKLFISRMVGVVKSKALTVSLSIVMVAVVSPAVFADSGTWSLDSFTSSARLFQGSRANPDSVNTGVARVTGKVKLDPNNLQNSVVDLNIFPADEDWEHALSPGGDLPTGYVPDATEHALLTFKSKRILKSVDGQLQVKGDLTLTRVERSITADPTEAYAGPVYGDPVIHTETREITFLFASLSAASGGPFTPVVQQTNRTLEVSGSTRVGHEEFPELSSAIQDTNWPSVVQNERCRNSYEGGGEGYFGPVCTGTLIAATTHNNCHMPASAGAEDYSGAMCTPPAGDQTTIVLDLKLLQTGSEPPAETLSDVRTKR